MAEGVGFEPTADARHDVKRRYVGISDIGGNKKHCRCSYFGSYCGRGESVETSEFTVLVGLFHGTAVEPASGALEAEFADRRSQACLSDCRRAR